MGEESDYREQIRLENQYRLMKGRIIMQQDDPHVVDFFVTLCNLSLLSEFERDTLLLNMGYC